MDLTPKIKPCFENYLRDTTIDIPLQILDECFGGRKGIDFAII